MYIKGSSCISPQNTFEHAFFASEPLVLMGPQMLAVEPDYADMIPNSRLRRMGKSNRMVIGASMSLVRSFPVDGIIIGTTDGGMDDCHKFLNQIIKYEEGTLTPTSFVQGSPSSPAGTLAVMAHNNGYNNTHTNKGISFENCLLDARMLLDEGIMSSLLVGNVEEISQAQFRIESLAGNIKQQPVGSDMMFGTGTPGTVNGEGAAMFVLDESPKNAIAQIVDLDVICHPSLMDLEYKAKDLLNRNGLEPKDVQCLLSGISGDSNTDPWYSRFSERLFPETGQLSFKNFFGETQSASAFATWFAAHLLSGSQIPDSAILKPVIEPITNLMIYNHYQGKQHGLILLRKV